MATINPIVESLKGYIDEQTNKDNLLAKTVCGSKSAKMFNLMTGVVGPTTINLLDTDVKFGDGSTCGFESDGSATITQRQIVPAILKVNMEFCERNFLETFKQYEVKLNAKMLDQDLTWENYILGHISDRVSNKLETMIYQGDSEEGSEISFDGLVKILTVDGAVEATKGATAYESILKVYNTLPEEAHAEDTTILVSAPLFRQFVQELVAGNMYHYNPNDKEGEYKLPGTDVKVVAVNGLNGSEVNIVAGRLGHIFYGTDLDGSEEDIKVVYDERTETILVKILFSAGVQVAFPEEIVYCKA